MKILVVGEELFYVDGRTDMMNLIVAVRNFANAPRNDNEKLQPEDFNNR
jgi:hypothetical protein